ncbi:hypothetical protein DQ384_08965 [Sphaerisporangium album]|uniref:Secreted protein n=1 Tax=Sphaerisporangium album TaxID=509200 RepID=A0A367FMP9_9ACTN|nr:hypothetical protein [Sphaerisporangium album]RCG31673.1 hypothetical protein DQ384_08965 [Sphaerisporangium album]
MNKASRPWICVTVAFLGLVAPATPAMAAGVASPSTTRGHTAVQSDASGGRVAAGRKCTEPLCGRVYNRDDRYRLLITDDWGSRNSPGTQFSLRPGQDGRDVGVRDVDGFWVGPGCKVKKAWIRTYGPGWHRVRDGQIARITDIKCR